MPHFILLTKLTSDGVKTIKNNPNRIADDGFRAKLAAGARRRRDELSWERTAADLAALISDGSS